MVTAARRYRTPCRLCSRRLEPGEMGANLTNSKASARQAGTHIRFWLCARCADKVEQAIDAMRKGS